MPSVKHKCEPRGVPCAFLSRGVFPPFSKRKPEGLLGRVAQIVDVPLEDSGEWMTGECTVYLRHMLHGLASAAPVHHLADYTIFIHDDAPRHLKPEFLSIVFKSLAMGSYNVDYLNLAHERYVAASTPCLKSLFRTSQKGFLTCRRCRFVSQVDCCRNI